MSGLVVQTDLCAPWAEVVKPGWRGPWPCTGESELRHKGQPFALAECTHECHHGGPQHELPALADRTALHPTDVLSARQEPGRRGQMSVARPIEEKPMEPDVDHTPCPVCGKVKPNGELDGHLQNEHHRDGGAPNPAPETKVWPPGAIETK